MELYRFFSDTISIITSFWRYRREQPCSRDELKVLWKKFLEERRDGEKIDPSLLESLRRDFVCRRRPGNLGFLCLSLLHRLNNGQKFEELIDKHQTIILSLKNDQRSENLQKALDDRLALLYLLSGGDEDFFDVIHEKTPGGTAYSKVSSFDYPFFRDAELIYEIVVRKNE